MSTASGVALATAFYELVPSMRGAQQQITEQLNPAAAGAGEAGGSSLGSALVGGIKKFALPIAGVLAAFSVKKLVDQSVESFESLAGSVKSFGRIAGGSTEQFSGLRGAMQLSGVDVDGATGALTIFSKNLGNASSDSTKAAAMQKKLGESFLDAAGNVKPMSEILPGLSDKFKAMPDGAEKSALATQLFGRSGLAMLPFLNQGSAGIGALTDKAKQMGLVLDDTSMRIFADGKKSAREYTTSIQGMKVALGQDLAPILEEVGNIGHKALIPVIQELAHLFTDAREPALKLADGIGKMADRGGEAVKGLIDLFAKGDFTEGLGKALGVEEDSKIVSGLLMVRSATVEVIGGVRAFFAAFKAGGDDVTSSGFAGVLEELGLKSRALFDQLGPVARQVFGALKDAAYPIVDAFHQLAPSLGPLIPQLLQLWTTISPVSLIFHALLPVLPQIAGLLGQLASVLGASLGNAIKLLLPAISGLAVQLAGGLTAAVQAIVPALLQIVPIAVGLIGQLVPVIAQVLAVVAPLVATLASALVPIIGQAGQLFAQLVRALLPVIPLAVQLVEVAAGIVVALLPLVSQLLPILVGLFIQLLPPIMQLASAVLPIAINIITVLMAVLMPLVQLLMALLIPAIQALLPVVTIVFQAVAAIITAAMQIVQGIIEVVTGIISGNWTQVWNGILNILGGIWNLIVATITGALNIFRALIVAAWTYISGITTSVFSGVVGFLGGIWGNIVGGVSGMIGSVGGFFSGLWGTITGALAGAGSWLYNAGVGIVQGLINGVRSLAGTIGNFFLSLLPGWIVGPFKLALGINSPSRLFHEFGRNISQGVVGGVSAEQGNVSAAMASMVQLPAMPTAYQPRSAGGAGSTAGGNSTGGSTFNLYGLPSELANQVDQQMRYSMIGA